MHGRSIPYGYLVTVKFGPQFTVRNNAAASQQRFDYQIEKRPSFAGRQPCEGGVVRPRNFPTPGSFGISTRHRAMISQGFLRSSLRCVYDLYAVAVFVICKGPPIPDPPRAGVLERHKDSASIDPLRLGQLAGTVHPNGWNRPPNNGGGVGCMSMVSGCICDLLSSTGRDTILAYRQVPVKSPQLIVPTNESIFKEYGVSLKGQFDL